MDRSILTEDASLPANIATRDTRTNTWSWTDRNSEKKIYVKKDAGPLLAWDVNHKYSYTSEASGGRGPDHIAIERRQIPINRRSASTG